MNIEQSSASFYEQTTILSILSMNKEQSSAACHQCYYSFIMMMSSWNSSCDVVCRAYLTNTDVVPHDSVMTALHAQQSASHLSSFSKTLNYLNSKKAMRGTFELDIAILWGLNVTQVNLVLTRPRPWFSRPRSGRPRPWRTRKKPWLTRPRLSNNELKCTRDQNLGLEENKSAFVFMNLLTVLTKFSQISQCTYFSRFIAVHTLAHSIMYFISVYRCTYFISVYRCTYFSSEYRCTYFSSEYRCTYFSSEYYVLNLAHCIAVLTLARSVYRNVSVESWRSRLHNTFSSWYGHWRSATMV